jgi:hypothetical protein
MQCYSKLIKRVGFECILACVYLCADVVLFEALLEQESKGMHTHPGMMCCGHSSTYMYVCMYCKYCMHVLSVYIYVYI